jgi:flavin-dependent dehydrogenase
MLNSFDIAIVGGGPSGSTLGSMLRKYAPHLRVALIEKERFPREHIGESLLPTTGTVLHEIGAWDKIEAAGFPIKIGATYRWGSSDDLWDFNLVDTLRIKPDDPRPGKYADWRVSSAFQVERGLFDKILLDHAVSLGCHVSEGVGVQEVLKNGDRIEGLELSDGSRIAASYYVDASGNSAVLRKAMGVDVEEPSALRNIAIWDYWENAEWAVSIGVGGTRVQVMSLGYGWLWFIPISPTRTSIGLVCPADYYKKSGKRTCELYREAVRSEPRIAALTANGKPDGEVRATKDWSFLSKRMVGANWFLAGESAGFADPILAAGITLAMVGAKECAYTLIELDRGEHDASWLRTEFEKRQTRRILQHIRFANFWYSGNGHFSELVEYTAEIAREAGFNMDAKSAWQWLGTGGFVSVETPGGLAGHSMEQIKNIQSMLFKEETDWALTRYNVFEVNIEGITVDKMPLYEQGKIRIGRVLRKGSVELPVIGGFRIMLDILQRETQLAPIIQALRAVTAKLGPLIALSGLEALEVMLKDGWVTGTYSIDQPLLRPQDIPRTPSIDWNHDVTDPKVRVSDVIKA